MNHVTRDQLAEVLVVKHSLTAFESRKVVDSLIDALAGALSRGENVELRGLGSFTIRRMKARPGRNPMRPTQVVIIPSRLTVRFRPGKRVKIGLSQVQDVKA